MPKHSLAKLERHVYATVDILRCEGMNAATYKDFNFEVLFPNRCSETFNADRQKIVAEKVARGMARAEAETQYGENLDSYYSFSVLPRARWPYPQECLNDASEPYGSVLDKALVAISEQNESLEHVVDHINFSTQIWRPE